MPYQVDAAQQTVAKQLGQSRPATTTAASVYSPADGVTTTVTSIVVAHVGAAAAQYRIFHDSDGTSYTQNTALFYDVVIQPGTTDVLQVDIYMLDTSGNLAVRTDTGNALTFTVYGEETQVRAR